MSTISDWKDLPTNYEDARYSGDRKFEMKKNADNTVSLTDVTVYENEDVSRTFFGAAEANQINDGMNKLVGAVNDVINIMYPVGSVYISFNPTNPSQLFGGQWEEIGDSTGNGVVLSAITTSRKDINSGTKGGSADPVLISHTHTPEEGEGFVTYDKNVGVSRAKINTSSGSRYGVLGNPKATAAVDSGIHFADYLNNTGTTDTSGANYPPYINVYMWKRTA